jgi:hypothetical protein
MAGTRCTTIKIATVAPNVRRNPASISARGDAQRMNSAATAMALGAPLR